MVRGCLPFEAESRVENAEFFSRFRNFRKTVTHMIGRRDDGTISHHGQDPIVQTKQFIVCFTSVCEIWLVLGTNKKGQLCSVDKND